MTFPYYHVDAFTDQAFAGNPAAVFVLSAARPEAWMQQVAGEMNLSETAFLVPRREEVYGLRWFTPTTEVDLCGHATLASAHVLWDGKRIRSDRPVHFETKSGCLTVRRTGSDWITMDFPSEPERAVEMPDELTVALSEKPRYFGRNRMDYIALLRDETSVRSLKPDLGILAKIGGRGLIVTAESDEGPYDFVSRFFAPQSGIAEDPVTGSAHCCLGPFWQERLGKDRMTGYQASARGGVVRVAVKDKRVLISGQAVTAAQGRLFS